MVVRQRPCRRRRLYDWAVSGENRNHQLEVNDEYFAHYISINERLKSVGYVSALIGKWHLTATKAMGPAITRL